MLKLKAAPSAVEGGRIGLQGLEDVRKGGGLFLTKLCVVIVSVLLHIFFYLQSDLIAMCWGVQE